MRLFIVAVLACSTLASRALPQDTWAQLRHAGLTAYDHGDYPTAEADLLAAQRALPVTSGSRPDQATLASDLAAVYQVTGRYQAAESLLNRAEQITLDTFGPAASEIASLHYRLASLYVDEGRLQEADSLAVQAVAALEPAPAGSPEKSAALRTLASVRVAENRFEEARQLHSRLLPVDAATAPEHTEKDLAALGRDDYNLSRFAEAQRLFEAALAQHRSGRQQNEVLYAIELNNLGQVEAALGHHKPAEDAYLSALSIWERKLGPRHQFLAQGRSNLATLYVGEHRWNEAEKLYRETLSLDREILGSNSPQVARDLNNLANVYSAHRKVSQAEPLLLEAIRITAQQGKAEAIQTAIEQANLAHVYSQQHNLEKAEALYREAVPVLQENRENRNPNLAEVLNQYAAVLRARHDYANAERLETAATRVKVEAAVQADRS